MAWVIVAIAAGCEVIWAAALKQSAGFTRLWPSVITILFMLASFFLLAHAMKSLPLGTAYAVWTGLGAVGAAAVGMAFLHDPISLSRILGITLILVGIVTLKLAD